MTTEKVIWNLRFWGLVMVCGVVIGAMTGCAGNGGQATPSWKPWRESSAALPAAKAGDLAALHRSFHAAFAEMTRPTPNQGEAAKEIADNLDSILVAVGDRTFAQALLRERPLTRSAVRDCMVEGALEKRYPLTFEVFQAAPQNEWPSDLAEEHETGTESQYAPKQEDQ